MAFPVRAIDADELPAMLEVDRRGFGAPQRTAGRPDTWVRAHLDRTRCAFEDDELVGCSRAYPFELTVPGGAVVPVAAVSAVAVSPTHRRRGILNAMMRGLLDDARERGECAAVLTASESSIYGRYGYGIATWRLACEIDRHRASLAPVDDTGRVRVLDLDGALETFPAVYDRARLQRAGAVSRPDYWWPECYWDEPATVMFQAVHEDEHGEADGFTAYEITGRWNDGLPDRTLVVHDLQATNARARAALWDYLLGVDLVGRVTATLLPVDDALRFRLRDPRRLRVSWINDSLWVAPLDVAALLVARRYTVAGRLVLDVGGERYALEATPEGASAVPTSTTADLACSRATLGALLLGGNSWIALHEAGLVEEHRGGALARADAMFATFPAPATLTWF